MASETGYKSCATQTLKMTEKQDDDVGVIINPLYVMSARDDPGNKITHVALRGPNYAEWSKGFRNALTAKGKINLVNGKVLKPAITAGDYDAWLQANCTVIAWIFNTIEEKLHSTISYRDTAYQLWDDIERRFTVKNEVKIFNLSNDIASCKQQPGEGIMEFYSRLTKIWEDVNDYDPLPGCSCSGCKCNIGETLRKGREKSQVRSLLMGVDSNFSMVRSQILGTEPLPDLHTVYSRLAQEEENIKLALKQQETRGLFL